MTNDPPHHRIRLADPILGDEELEAVRAVFASGVLTDGPATLRFEAACARRHDTEHTVAFSSGTAGLAAMHLALGIGPGDEVVVPSMTFISTATSVLHVGGRPVFADVRPDTFTLDPEDVARRITPSTKAIVAVHYGGQPADLAELQAVADDAGVALLEDAAEAHGATYRQRPVGGYGRMAMFSFTPTKNVTTGEGGVVTTDDGELAERLRLLRNHGQQSSTSRHVLVGFNWRLSELQAAIGAVQMEKLERILHQKQAQARKLDDALAASPGVTTPFVADDRDHVYMLYTVLIEGCRDHVARGLHDAGIESRIYFPPAHREPIFEPSAELPVTDWAAARMLTLPSHVGIPAADLQDVADHVDRLVRSA